MQLKNQHQAEDKTYTPKLNKALKTYFKYAMYYSNEKYLEELWHIVIAGSWFAMIIWCVP